MIDILNMPLTLNLFAASNTNVTTDGGLSPEMKTYYSDYLIDMVSPKLVHDQFGQKKPIPRNGGKTIEFRRYSPLPKILAPLTEGVTPDGQKLNVSTVEATVKQYGGYVELSDILLLTAIDRNLIEATKLIASQGGRTSDTITREVLNGGTNAIFGNGKAARYLLTGGSESGNDYLTVDAVKRAVRNLKTMNAEPLEDGNYVGIIHPDVTYDLTNDPAWQRPHEYVDTEHIYSGEIGRIAGVRFVETSEAKKFVAKPLTGASRNLTTASYTASGYKVVVKEAISSDEASALVGRKVIIGSETATISAAVAGSAGSAYINLSAAPSVSPTDGVVIYPGEAGASGRDVYSTLIIAANAYGVTEVSGGGMQHIVKQLGSAGTGDPLDQRATCGWKATKTAVRLVEEYMVRIETCSSFNEHGEN